LFLFIDIAYRIDTFH